MIAAALLTVLTVLSAPVLSALPVAYLCIWLGIVLPLARVGATNDFSYGIYIYAFPVQQLLAVAGVQAWGVAAFTLLSVAGTIPLAVASWFVLERRAIGWGRSRHSSALRPAPEPGLSPS